jgi:hypothetical protein
LPTCLCNNQGDKIPHVSKTPLQRPVKKIWGQKRKKKTKKKKKYGVITVLGIGLKKGGTTRNVNREDSVMALPCLSYAYHDS